MLEVAVDLVPIEQHHLRSNLAHLVVVNDGSGTSELGNYRVYLQFPFGEREVGKYERHGKLLGTLSGVDRSRGRNHLAAKALEWAEELIPDPSAHKNLADCSELAKIQPGIIK